VPAVVEPVRVDLDIPVTRRQRVHEVLDGKGVVVFYAREISAVFDWLAENEVAVAHFVDDELAFLIKIEKVRSPPPQTKG